MMKCWTGLHRASLSWLCTALVLGLVCVSPPSLHGGQPEIAEDLTALALSMRAQSASGNPAVGDPGTAAWVLDEVIDDINESYWAQGKRHPSYDYQYSVSQGTMSMKQTYIGETDKSYRSPKMTGEGVRLTVKFSPPPEVLFPGDEVSIKASLTASDKTLSFFRFGASGWVEFTNPDGTGRPGKFVDQQGQYQVVLPNPKDTDDYSTDSRVLIGEVPSGSRDGQRLGIRQVGANMSTQYIYRWHADAASIQDAIEAAAATPECEPEPADPISVAVQISANRDQPTVYDSITLTANIKAPIHGDLSYRWFLNDERQAEEGNRLALGNLKEGWYRARVEVRSTDCMLSEAELDFSVQLPMILEVKNEPTLEAPLTFTVSLRYLDATGNPRPLVGRELKIHAFNINDNWARLKDSVGIDSLGMPRLTDTSSPFFAKTRDDGKITLVFYPDFAKFTTFADKVHGLELPSWDRPQHIEIHVEHHLDTSEWPQYRILPHPPITHSESAAARLDYMAFVTHIEVLTPHFQTGHVPNSGPIFKGESLALSRYERHHDSYNQRWSMGQSRVQFKRSGTGAISAPESQSGWGNPLRRGQKLGSGDQILIDARELRIVPRSPSRLPPQRLLAGTGNIQVYVTFLDQFQGAIRVHEKLEGQRGFKPFTMVIGTPQEQFDGWSLHRWIAKQVGDQIVEKSLRSKTASALSLALPGAGKIYGIQSTLGAISDISRFGDVAYIRILNTAYHVMSDGEGQVMISTREGEVGVSHRPDMDGLRVVSKGRTALLSQDGSISIQVTDPALAKMADELLRGPLDEYGNEITVEPISQEHSMTEPPVSRSPELEILQPAPASPLRDEHGLPNDLSQELEKQLTSARHHVKLGDFEQALEALDRALEISPANQDVQGNLRRVHYLRDAADRQLQEVYDLAAKEQFNEARQRLLPIKNANPRYPPVHEAEEHLRIVQWARNQAFQEAMGQMRLAMEQREIEEALGRIAQIRLDFMLSSHETVTLRDNEVYLTGLLSRKNEARRLFRSGEKKLHAHDYRGAIEDFKAAFSTGQNLWSMSDPEPNHYSPMLAEALRRHERFFELVPHIDRAAKGDITEIDINQIRIALGHVDELLTLQPGSSELLKYQRLLHDRLELKGGEVEVVIDSPPTMDVASPVESVEPVEFGDVSEISRKPAGPINTPPSSDSLGPDKSEQSHNIEVGRHGVLRVQVQAESGLRVWMQLFDDQGNRLGSTSTSSSLELTRPDLAPGTYVAQVIRSSGEGAYVITPTLEANSHANDSEPNNEVIQAQPIALGLPTQGLLGYVSRGAVDDRDWFSFETSSHGGVTVKVEAEASLRAWMQLLDADGNRLGSTSTASNLELTRPDLAPGTYFVHLIRSSGQGGYVVTPTLEANSHANDQEPNNEVGQAQPIDLGQATQGLLGYVSRGNVDDQDWFLFEAHNHGSVEVTVQAEESLRVWMQLFDADGRRLGSTSTSSSPELSRPDLVPGAYFIQLIRSSGQGGYTIKPAFRSTSGNP